MSKDADDDLDAKLAALLGPELAAAVLRSRDGGPPAQRTIHVHGCRIEQTLSLTDDGQVYISAIAARVPSPLIPLDAIADFMAQREGGEDA